MASRNQPQDDYDFSRLADAVNASSIVQQFPRTKREELVRAMAGPNWSDETSTDMTRPVNLLDLFAKVIIPSLIAQNPRVLLSTWQTAAKPAVNAMQAILNQQIYKQDVCETMQRAAMDALFGTAIVMVALGSPMDAAMSYQDLQGERAGQYFIELIDFDDFLVDPHARRFSQATWIGHRLRRPLKAVKSDKTIRSGEVRAQDDRKFNPEGDQRISVLSRSQRIGSKSEAEDMVELVQVWVARENMMVLYATDEAGHAIVDSDGKPLRTQKFVGPPCGPYHFLGYGIVPGNAPFKGPMSNLAKLDEAVNRLFNKLIHQAEDQKTVVGVQGQADADGNRILAANDGQVIRLDDPKNVVTMKFGGADPTTFQMADSLKMLFAYMAGNMDSFGGLSAQSKTVGQDRMLAENASRMIQDMQARTVAFNARVLGACAWYEWEHPTNVRSYEHKLPGFKKGLTRDVYPRGAKDDKGNPRLLRRDIPYDQLDLRVDPFSLQPQTPQTRLQQMNGVVTQIIIPMMQILAASGVQFDANAYLKKVGEYMDMPDLAEILTIAEPAPPDGGGGDEPTKPANTNRTYTRENVPMRTEKGASQQLQAKLAGVNTGGAKETAGVQQ